MANVRMRLMVVQIERGEMPSEDLSPVQWKDMTTFGVSDKTVNDQIKVRKKIGSPGSMSHRAQRKRPLDFATYEAPAHRAKSTQDWCLAHLPDFIRVCEWPSSSSDLNVLDFSIWAVLEQKASQKKHTSV
ncbi:hypothetical protein ANCDUO_05032 [Ancylostoma duodenale]|uniref:Uncharacterized protein n=1 Tax=Ancylostoma duodenale TaxID=51022 RepID=A0A0C2DPR1_9BILA|nr:hypothetical protein ANCDUO_05032 [Ancylostoma duodenale]